MQYEWSRLKLYLPFDLPKGGLGQSRGGLTDRDEAFQGAYLQMRKVPSVALLPWTLQRPPNPARHFLGHKSHCPAEMSTKSIELLMFGKVGRACMTPLREEKPLLTILILSQSLKPLGSPETLPAQVTPGGKAELSVPKTTEFSVLFCSGSGLFCNWN